MKKQRTQKKQARLDNIIKFSRDKLQQELVREGRAVNLQVGAAEDIAARTAKEVEKWAKARTAITQKDLNRAVAKIVEKYNADLAYVYKNRGKII